MLATGQFHGLMSAWKFSGCWRGDARARVKRTCGQDLDPTILPDKGSRGVVSLSIKQDSPTRFRGISQRALTPAPTFHFIAFLAPCHRLTAASDQSILSHRCGSHKTVLSNGSMYQTTGNFGSLMASCFHAQGRWRCAASPSRCGEAQWLRRVTRHQPWFEGSACWRSPVLPRSCHREKEQTPAPG